MSGLARRLRLIVVTDRASAHPRDMVQVATTALDAGAPALQLRDKTSPPRDLLPVARRLAAAARAAGALFFVNDRFDLALAAGAHGVHLGALDLPVRAARRAAPPGFLIGATTGDPAAARAAATAGADYVGCGPVYPTRTKTQAGPAIGVAGLATVVDSVDVPVVGIGGIELDRAVHVFRTGATGCAVAGAVMGAADPGGAAKALLAAAPVR